MSSIWRHQIYFLFGFLTASIVILIITSSEISIIMVYLCLCKGDYNWWWKSFFIGGSPAIYFIGYSIFYFFNLNIVRFSTFFIYFGCMGIITSLIFFICGGVSVLTTFLFLTKIYSQIKID
ncbi:MAG: transmembrane 9 family protein [archaeon]|nr:transmembrane 9 family protein [archaeon]